MTALLAPPRRIVTPSRRIVTPGRCPAHPWRRRTRNASGDALLDDDGDLTLNADGLAILADDTNAECCCTNDPNPDPDPDSEGGPLGPCNSVVWPDTLTLTPNGFTYCAARLAVPRTLTRAGGYSFFWAADDCCDGWELGCWTISSSGQLCLPIDVDETCQTGLAYEKRFKTIQAAGTYDPVVSTCQSVIPPPSGFHALYLEFLASTVVIS